MARDTNSEALMPRSTRSPLAAELVYEVTADVPSMDLRAGDYVVARPGHEMPLVIRRVLPLEAFAEIPPEALSVIHATAGAVPAVSAVVHRAVTPLRLVK